VPELAGNNIGGIGHFDIHLDYSSDSQIGWLIEPCSCGQIVTLQKRATPYL
jgi:hypothetical protein